MTRITRAALALLLTALLTVAGVASTTGAALSLTNAAAPVAGNADDAGVELALAGTLVVSVVEAPPIEGEHDRREDSERLITVQTTGGASVPVVGEQLDRARTGDTFDGVVRVPDEVVDEIGGPVEERVRDRRAGSALSVESAEGTAIADAAAKTEQPLPVVDASVTEAAVAPASPRDHIADVVVVNPAGVAPLGGSFTDAKLLEMTDAGGNWWEAAAVGAPGTANITSFTNTPQVSRITSPHGCDQPLDLIWDTAAQHLGYADAVAYLMAAGASAGPVRHLVTYLPPGCLDVEPIAVATVGASASSGGLAMVTLGSDYDARNIVHELGHNLSLGHANLDFCDADAVVLGCTQYEYGDYYDVMGAMVPGSLAALNAASEVALGWHDPATTANLALAADETSRTWTVSLSSLETAGSTASPRIVAVTDPITGEVYTVEHRPETSNVAFYDWGAGYYMDYWAERHPVLYDDGVRLVRAAWGTTSVLTSPSQQAGLNQSSAAASASLQRDVISNPSKSVRVKVLGGDPTGAVNVEVTLSRPVDGATPVFRFWSDRFQGHFYTIDPAERDRVMRTWPDVWRYEGSRYTAFPTQVPGTVPLYRFWSESFKGHFYTIDAAERDRVIRTWPDVWSYEGVAYYVYPLESFAPNTVEVSRFWSPSKRHHFYTADPLERDHVIRTWPSPIWDYEGSRFRVPYTG